MRATSAHFSNESHNCAYWKPEAAINASIHNEPRSLTPVMTDDEIKPYVGKAVRVTMADGAIFAGTLHAHGDHGHGHVHYAVVSDPITKGGENVVETIHGGDRITQIEDASSDPAAVE